MKGNYYQLTTTTVSSMQGTLSEDSISFTVQLTDTDGSVYETEKSYPISGIPINYSLTGIESNPKEITNLAFGMFLLDIDGYVGLTKSQRTALAKLIESHPGAIDIELYANGSVFEYRGGEVIANTPTRRFTKPSVALLTRTFFKNFIQPVIH